MANMPNLSRLDWVILGLLADSGRVPIYGLDMVQKSAELKRGTIYVNLAKLQKLGLVMVSQGKSTGGRGRPRNQYRLSGKGARLVAVEQMFRTGMEEVSV